jgi:UTP--glucose-1-phosphate uridylyltransferase
VDRTVRTAVIPAAGLGTRFLPATKVVPKGLIPVVDTPAIQLVVQEALRAGLDDVIVVIGPGQEPIPEHFAAAPALEAELEARGKTRELDLVRASTLPQVRFVVQEEARGLGHAVATAAPLVGDRSFAVLLGDDLIDPAVPLLRGMLEAFARGGSCVVAAFEVGEREIAMYGCFEPEPTDDPRRFRIVSIVEKPDPAEAPSRLAAVGRYVFTPRIFDALASTAPGRLGEIQLTDAIDLLAHEEPAFGYVFERGRFDVGNPLDHLTATLTLALAREDIGPELRARLRRVLGDA